MRKWFKDRTSAVTFARSLIYEPPLLWTKVYRVIERNKEDRFVVVDGDLINTSTFASKISSRKIRIKLVHWNSDPVYES